MREYFLFFYKLQIALFVPSNERERERIMNHYEDNERRRKNVLRRGISYYSMKNKIQFKNSVKFYNKKMRLSWVEKEGLRCVWASDTKFNNKMRGIFIKIKFKVETEVETTKTKTIEQG